MQNNADSGFESIPDRPLSPFVDRDRLLSQIVQGLLTAHARLDLMEERLKQATSEAVKEPLKQGLVPLRQIEVDLKKQIKEMNENLVALGGIEDRLKQATINVAQTNLQAAIQVLESNVDHGSKQAATLDGILAILCRAKDSFGEAAAQVLSEKVDSDYNLIHHSIMDQKAQLSGYSLSLKTAITEAKNEVLAETSAVVGKLETTTNSARKSIIGSLTEQAASLADYSQETKSGINGIRDDVWSYLQKMHGSVEKKIKDCHVDHSRRLDAGIEAVTLELKSARAQLKSARDQIQIQVQATGTQLSAELRWTNQMGQKRFEALCWLAFVCFSTLVVLFYANQADFSHSLPVHRTFFGYAWPMIVVGIIILSLVAWMRGLSSAPKASEKPDRQV